MIKSILKWLILTSLMVYAAWAAIWARGEAKLHGCKDIVVNISHSATADTVTRSGVLDDLSRYPEAIIGRPMETINTLSIEKYLGQFSNFEEVNCVLTTNGILNVNVVPMIPALRVFDGNKSYYINKDGKEIRSKANFYVDVPVVAGKFSDTFRPVELLPVVRFVNSDSILNKLVGMIEAKDAGNIILVPRIHGHVVNFGDTTRLKEKRQALLTVYRKVMPYKGWEEYDTISVKFKGQVVATRRNKSISDHGADYSDDIDLEEATLAATFSQPNG